MSRITRITRHRIKLIQPLDWTKLRARLATKRAGIRERPGGAFMLSLVDISKKLGIRFKSFMIVLLLSGVAIVYVLFKKISKRK